MAIQRDVLCSLLLLSGLGLGPLVRLTYAREDLIPGSRYTSGRAAAMGDAFLPLGDDPAAGLFYNPAVLGKVRRLVFEPINLSGYMNMGYLGYPNSDALKVTDLRSYAQNLTLHPDNAVGVGGAFLPCVGFSGISFGILTQSHLLAQSNDDGSISYRSLYQIIPSAGIGFQLFDNFIRFGYSLQWVNEAVGANTVSPEIDPSELGYNVNLSQGSAFSHNFGLAITFPVRSLPAINVVVRNAFDTHYSPYSIVSFTNSSIGVPATEPMTVDASFSLQPRLGVGVTSNIVFEDRDITNRSGADFIAHLSIGAELNFKNRLFLRGGYGSGYPSAGLGLKRTATEASITWYTEELGARYMSQGDTRLLFQYQIKVF